VRAPVEVAALPAYDLAAALALVRDRGIRALLCEGGPTLFAALLEDDLVDELFLTVAPLVTGDDGEPRIVTGATLAAPRRLRLEHVLRSGHELYLRYSVDRG
jgi:riboflavin biosynthesis pyrimidine reductase